MLTREEFIAWTVEIADKIEETISANREQGAHAIVVLGLGDGCQSSCMADGYELVTSLEHLADRILSEIPHHQRKTLGCAMMSAINSAVLNNLNAKDGEDDEQEEMMGEHE